MCNDSEHTCKNPLLSIHTLYAGQYQLPSTPLQQFWDERNSQRRISVRSSPLESHQQDVFRVHVYRFLEAFFNYWTNSGDGFQCVLRLICENTQISWQEHLLTRILQIILEMYVRQKLILIYRIFSPRPLSVLSCLSLFSSLFLYEFLSHIIKYMPHFFICFHVLYA